MGPQTRGLIRLAILFTLVSATRGICPSKCTCNDKLLKAGCEYSNLEVVPIQLNPEIRTLKLNHNRIASIHLTFIFYKNLNELDLSHNKIKTLGSKNFEFQINLTNLNVSSNMVKQLHKDSFKGLKKLTVLDLSGNLIEEVSDRTSFKDLTNLEELNLSRNKIYMIETGVFDYLINLKRLIMHDNELLKVPENAVNTLNNLVEMDLNGNLIEDLSFPSNLNNLEVLKLRSNVITSLGNDSFSNLYRLKYLDLSDNNFTHVSKLQFSKLLHLEYLNLSSNLFRHLGPDSFRNLYKLTEVYIDNAVALRKVDSKLFIENINLKYVSLSNNANLKYLPKFLFLNKPKLKHIRISGNDFSTLDASDLPLDQLETLKIGRNPFKCNCSLLWLWILKERQMLNNCTCTDLSCYEACADAVPKPKKLSEESETVLGLAFHREVYPIILDLDEVYCEDYQNARRIPFKAAPKSSFDCTVTWVLILTAAVLATLFLFLLAVIAYILRIRCKRRAKNPVETFINATKSYEDTHHTYYRYGSNLRNGDVFEVLKSEQKIDVYGDKPATNMYIRTPLGKDSANSFPYAINRVDTEPRKQCRKQYSNASIPDAYLDAAGNYGMKNYMSETNIYQEPFAGPFPARTGQRPPHIVYV
ncbi:UNVERIFIED_CONTAM: hypothetical protein PYX00_010408 [Menopon gallinae]|uniref:Uncharacterized protein n=1 Tax=Menopon gallinae TaxID=328185 RepID=A0AAW2HFM5_9NEOP